MKIVLIGYMGSGKSSVGKKLAEVLEVPFVDLDAEIEKQEGISVQEIFAEKGEIYFRKSENTVLKNLLLKPGNFVLATGGGTPCYGDAMDFITTQKEVVSVYLKSSLEVLVARLIRGKENRPLLSHLETEADLTDFVRKHLFERGFYYNRSKLIVDNALGNVDDTVAKITRNLV